MVRGIGINRMRVLGDSPKRRRLLAEAGLLLAVLVANGVLGVFSHYYTNAAHFDDLRTLETLRQALDATRLAQIHFKTQVQEWKNVLLRGDEPADYDHYFASFEEQERRTDQSLKEAQRLSAALGVGNGDIDRLLEHHRELGRIYREGLKLLDPADPRSHHRVDDHVRGVDRSLLVEIDGLADRLRQEAGVIHARIEADSRARYQTLGWAAFALIAVGFVLILLFVASATNGRREEE
ncbi:hypothetical protein [Endothiovibrio diazotrophicus]